MPSFEIDCVVLDADDFTAPSSRPRLTTPNFVAAQANVFTQQRWQM
jgi:hypothetical protein